MGGSLQPLTFGTPLAPQVRNSWKQGSLQSDRPINLDELTAMINQALPKHIGQVFSIFQQEIQRKLLLDFAPKMLERTNLQSLPVWEDLLGVSLYSKPQSLPSDILTHIFTFNEHHEKCFSIFNVCKLWRKVVSSPKAWTFLSIDNMSSFLLSENSCMRYPTTAAGQHVLVQTPFRIPLVNLRTVQIWFV